ncbi:MAG TPA: sarcosine oxidase subunit gamma family protein [Steroidobacteraceae bacterium]
MREPTTSLVPQSALPAGGRVFSDTLRLSIPPQRVTLRLQVSARSLATVSAIRIAGRPLPITANCWTGTDPVISRIAPDTWLFQSSLHDATDILQAVRKACGRRMFVVTDLSDTFVTFTLEGAQATALLARGCGLDFSLSTFHTSSCTRTRLAQLPAVIRRASFERFECLVDRAVAQYLYDWFQDAAASLG